MVTLWQSTITIYKQVMVNPTDEEHKHIKDQKYDTRGYLEYNLNKLKRARYANSMWGNKQVNKMTGKNCRETATASIQ